MGAHYSSHLFEQYKGNLSFGFHIVVCICAHVVQLVCLQDQVHNLFIPCPHGRFDLTFERCTFCSFIITSSHSKLHSSCRRGLGYKCGLTAQTLVDPTKGPQIEEGEGPGISGTQTLVSQSRSHRIRGQQDRVDTSVLQRVTYASLQRFPPPGLKLLHSTGLPQSTFITALRTDAPRPLLVFHRLHRHLTSGRPPYLQPRVGWASIARCTVVRSPDVITGEYEREPGQV